MPGEIEQVVVKYQLDLSDVKQQFQQMKADMGDFQQTTAASGKTVSANLGGSLEDVRDKVKDVGTEIKQTFAGNQMESAVKGMNDYVGSVDKVQKAQASLRQEWIASRNEVYKLVSAGKQNTLEYENAVKATGKLQKEMMLTKEALRNTAGEFKGLRAAMEGVRAIGAIYELQIASSELFGEKNEALMESMRKLQTVMALVQGLTEIGNALRKESALMTGLQEAKTYAYGTALKVVTAIEETFGITSAQAMAVATLGLSLLVAGIVVLIANWDKATEAVMKFMGVEENAIEKGRIEAVKNLKDRVDGIQKVYDQEIAMQKAKGDKSHALEQERLNDFKQVIADNQKLVEQEATAGNITQQEAMDDYGYLMDKKAAISLREAEIETQIRNEQEEAEKKRLAAIMTANKAEDAALAKKLSDWNKQQDDIDKRLKETRLSPEINAIKIEKVPEVPVKLVPSADPTDLKWQVALESIGKQAFKIGNDIAKGLGSAFDKVFAGEIKNVENATQQMELILNKWQTRALDSAGDNAQKRAAIEKRMAIEQDELKREQAIKEAKIKREQAIMDKVISLGNIAANTAEAIMKQTKGLPGTAGLLAEAIVSGAIQAAMVAAIPLPAIPKFAKGVIRLKGRGTETSDSIPAFLSVNESVIPAQPSKHYTEELEAIKNMQFEHLIYSKYVRPALQVANHSGGSGDSYDDWLLRKDVREGNYMNRKNAEYIVRGVTDGMKWISYTNTRYHA